MVIFLVSKLFILDIQFSEKVLKLFCHLILFVTQVSLHVAFVHSFVNPLLFIVLHKGCRKATLDLLCCNFSPPQGNLRTP